MLVFGSELRFHSKLKDIKIGPLAWAARVYLQIFGIFGISSDGGHLRSRYFRKILNKHKFEFHSALDAGCGHGYYSFYMAKKNPHAMIDAFDFSPDAISENKYILKQTKIENLNFSQINLTELNESNTYDLAFSIDVLEHIEEDEKVINNIYKSLNHGGHLILHAPQKNQPDNWQEECPDHVREGYTIDEISQILEKNGFEVIEKSITWGLFGQMAHRIHSFLPTKYLKSLFAMPINCIAWIDTLFKQKTGRGFIVIGRKEKC